MGRKSQGPGLGRATTMNVHPKGNADQRKGNLKRAGEKVKDTFKQ
jgi:hypothetical protein